MRPSFQIIDYQMNLGRRWRERKSWTWIRFIFKKIPLNISNNDNDSDCDIDKNKDKDGFSTTSSGPCQAGRCKDEADCRLIFWLTFCHLNMWLQQYNVAKKISMFAWLHVIGLINQGPNSASIHPSIHPVLQSGRNLVSRGQKPWSINIYQPGIAYSYMALSSGWHRWI